MRWGWILSSYARIRCILRWSFFASSGFWMFDVCDHTNDIGISRGLQACRKRGAGCQVMGRGVLFGDKPTGHKFCRDRQTALYVSNNHYGFTPSEAAQFSGGNPSVSRIASCQYWHAPPWRHDREAAPMSRSGPTLNPLGLVHDQMNHSLVMPREIGCFRFRSPNSCCRSRPRPTSGESWASSNPRRIRWLLDRPLSRAMTRKWCNYSPTRPKLRNPLITVPTLPGLTGSHKARPDCRQGRAGAAPHRESNRAEDWRSRRR